MDAQVPTPGASLVAHARWRILVPVLVCVVTACGSAGGEEPDCLALCAEPDASPDSSMGEPASSPEHDVSLESLLEEMTDLERLARVPDPPYRSLLSSSRDRASVAPGEDGWFSNFDGGSFEGMDGDEHIMLDVEGPGAITRIWSANPNGVWRFYVDDLSEPALEVRLGELTSGAVIDLEGGLAYVSARGHTVHLPIPFSRRMRVTTDGDIQFHHFNYRRYPEGTSVQPFSLEVLDEARCGRARTCTELMSPGVATGETTTTMLGGGREALRLAAGASGGAIRELRIRPADPSEASLRESTLVASFDGAETVRVPLGDFFGGGPGLNALESLPVSVGDDGTLVARWVMPFETGASISVIGTDADVEVVHRDFDWDETAMHFHARWRPPEDLSTEVVYDWELATIDGQGVYVGTVLNVHNPVEKWWGEGDERIRVDGGPWTDWLGTGTEDYFGYAWSSNELFSRPFHGQRRADGPRNMGRVVNYRWHLLDAIPFDEQLEFLLEIHHWQKGEEAVTMTYDAVVVWYARPGSVDTVPAFERGFIP